MPQSPRKSLFWIASYPKSGNTWLRVFLANYLLGDGSPMALNDVAKLGYADGEIRRYERANNGPYDRSDARKTVALRNTVLTEIATTGPNVALVKTHNYNSTIDNTALIPAALTKGAIYVARHPCDVAISFASHYGLSLDATIERMGEKRAVIGGSDATALQFTSDWSTHVQSWAGAKQHNVKVIRYEDMHSTPQKTFGDVLRHIGVPVETAKLDRAIKNASFDKLHAQEKSDGFSENTVHQPQFFRQGKAGGWGDVLSDAQISEIQTAHGTVMKKLGYT